MSFISYQLETAFCLSFFYIIYIMLFKRETFFKINRFVLMILLFASFIIPIIELPISANTLIEAPPIDITEIIETKQVFEEPSYIEEVNYWVIVPIVNTLAIIFSILLLLIGLFKIFRLSRKSEKCIVNDVEVKLVEMEYSPFTFMNTIYLSKSSVEFPNIDSILQHEQIHKNQFHSIDMLLFGLLKPLQWFNPIIYLWGKEIKEVHEYLADYETIKFKNEYNSYIYMLLNSAFGVNISSYAHNFNKSKILRRIKMMTKPKSSSISIMKYLTLLPAVFMMVFIFSCKDQVEENIPEIDFFSDIYQGIECYRDSESYTLYSLDYDSDTIRVLNYQEDYVKLKASVPDNDNNKKYLDKYPRPKGADSFFDKALRENILFHRDLLKQKKAMKVTFQFKVDKKGNISNPTVIKHRYADMEWSSEKLPKNIEESIISAFNNIGIKFEPGKKNGKPIDCIVGRTILLGDVDEYYKYNMSRAVYVKVKDISAYKGFENPVEKSKTGVHPASLLSGSQVSWLVNNLKYPEKALKDSTEGTVTISFSVDSKGKAQNVKVSKSLSKECDQEALRVVSMMNGFEPNLIFDGSRLIELPIKFIRKFKD